MPAPSHLDHFDLDIGLRDASCDENLPPVRRAIAALCIGVVSQVEHNTSPLGQVALVAAVTVFCLAALAGLVAAGWSLLRQVLELIEDIRDGREARRRAVRRPTS